jgi:hypothetical protein
MRELIAKVPAGSRLYGYATENSDYDWIEITMPTLSDCVFNKLHVNQKIIGDQDTVRMSFPFFVKGLETGSIQAVETLFYLMTRTPEHQPLRGFINSVASDLAINGIPDCLLSGHYGVVNHSKVKTGKDYIMKLRVANQLWSLLRCGFLDFPLILPTVIEDLLRFKKEEPPEEVVQSASNVIEKYRSQIDGHKAKRKNFYNLRSAAIECILNCEKGVI